MMHDGTNRYPKQQRLLTLKKAMVAEYALPPTYLAMADLHVLTASSSHSRTSSLTLPPPITQPQPQQQQTQPQQPTGERQASPSPLKSPTTIQHPLPNPPSTTANLLASPAPTHASASSLTHLIPLPTGPCKFDVILIDPPFSSSFSWDHLEKLPIPQLAADPSYVFLWVGSGAGEGLERGREVLGRWGYRRCEDVVWVKTNWDSCKGPGVSVGSHTERKCVC
jgi:mRNA (2'-O-methyladenosine-N6-)-methyltransferase